MYFLPTDKETLPGGDVPTAAPLHGGRSQFCLHLYIHFTIPDMHMCVCSLKLPF